jgi:PAS domain S-box-containing protein
MRIAAHGPDLPSLQELVDSVPALIHMGRPDGYLDFFNKRWLDFFGLRLEDLEGWKWTAVIHPDDVTALVARWRACLASGEPFEFESRVRRADGEYRWMLHQKVAVRDECGQIVQWYGSSFDIEDRKQAEDRIRGQEMELRQILDLMPEHLGVLGPDARPLYANRVALEYLGMDMDQWRADWSRLDRLHPDDREQFLDQTKRLLEGVAHEFEARWKRHDGVFRWFLVRQNPLKDERGHITQWYSAATDIDDRKQAEERLQQENVVLRDDIDKASMFEEIVGTSPALQPVLARVSKVARSDSTVLITGETGTGKELVARAIHRRSARSARPFVSVNCAAVPRELIAAELFGHEKGAFTGATQRRLGRFELAHGGTIFLDEVGELPMETQIALLRVLQEREFERVGASTSIRVDVRVIAATNRDLQAAIEGGTFRSDLFYRLDVFPIAVPPLRERADDIPLLVEYLIDRYARKAGKTIRRVNMRTLDHLRSYPWPGNVRELQNVVERSVIVCDTDEFTVDESWLSARPAVEGRLALSGTLAAHEKAIIEEALRVSGGRVFGPSGAAARLGIPRSTLESKIRALRISKSRFRPRPAKSQ